MKRNNETLFHNITLADVYTAIASAEKNHEHDFMVVSFNRHRRENAERIYNALKDGSYTHLLRYRPMRKRNSNGQVRDIMQPDFVTRILQHLFLVIAEPLYKKKDPLVGLNCKKYCGITAKWHRGSVLKRTKHVFYDLHRLEYAVVVDERASYAHCTIRDFRRGLQCLTTDKAFIAFAVDVTFIDGELPIGTPSSPFAHHIIHLRFDLWLNSVCPLAVRYADDVFAPTQTKEEAQQLLWRIRNHWWYELGIRIKHGGQIRPLSDALDFCGYILHRGSIGRAKGYTTVRRRTLEAARRSKNNKSWGSYFGILSSADTFTHMCNIEDKMQLNKLTDKIRIDRRLDARNIEIKELLGGVSFDVIDYDMRRDKAGAVNWIKFLIGIPTEDGRVMAREFHGNFQGLIQFILACEEQYDKNALLPITGCTLENQCGYIFTASTNQITYL